MSKPVKQLLIFIALVIFIQLLSSPFQGIGNYIYLTIKDNLSTFGMDFNAKDAYFSLPIKITVPHSETKIKNRNGKERIITLDNLDLSLSILDLLKLKRTININSDIYNGKANIYLSQALFSSSNLYLDGTVENTQIQPLLEDKRFKGILSAKIKSNMPIIKGLVDFKDNMNGNIKIRDGEYLGADKIAGLMVLPQAKDIKIDFDLKGEKSSYKLERISIASTLGVVSGDAKFDFGNSNLNYPEKMELDLKIELSDLGSSAFSDYIKLTCKTQAQPGQKNWHLMLKKDKGQLFPVVESEPL